MVKKKTKKSQFLLTMEGGVFLVEKRNGRTVRKDSIDGVLVLQLIKLALEHGLDKVRPE